MKKLAVLLGVLLVLVLGHHTLRAPVSIRPLIWTEPWTGIDFVFIHASTFRMGSPQSEAGREPQEIPHPVTLTTGYILGQTEVTQAQWTTVMGVNPGAFPDCPSCPVEQVSFYDVQAFLSRLNQRSGPGFRLPTEAEWEHACRAGGTEPFGHASSLGSRDANIDGAYPYLAPKGPSRGRTTEVRSFLPNAFGLYDMQGNVWEWTGDPYCPYPQAAATDPFGRCGSEYRVIRGGSWKFDGNSARCALRYTHRPQDSGPSVGFRLARDLS
jgi:formylglycine-generating enzyme required for sulfatase activity